MGVVRLIYCMQSINLHTPTLSLPLKRGEDLTESAQPYHTEQAKTRIHESPETIAGHYA
jgi:hypothetical protein